MGDLGDVQGAMSTSIQSVANAIMGTLAGGVVDSFFESKEDEDILSTLFKLSAQSLAGGLVLQLYIQSGIASSDGNKGVYLVYPYIASQRHFNARIGKVARDIRMQLTDVFKPIANAQGLQ